MTTKLKIDFVSDVVCPWCAIGLNGLAIALERLGPDVEADITFHPFQLNPDLPAEGMIHLDFITSRMGISANDAQRMRAQIRGRAAAVGLEINRDDTTRIYNTFDAHRLLAWAENSGKQKALSETLMFAYFTELQNLGDADVLIAAVEKAGLDAAEARRVLRSDRYAHQVREEERLWRSRGVRSVPTVLVNGRDVIGGGHPLEECERQLRALLGSAKAA